MSHKFPFRGHPSSIFDWTNNKGRRLNYCDGNSNMVQTEKQPQPSQMTFILQYIHYSQNIEIMDPSISTLILLKM